jgi:hypothetical protein
MTLTQIWQFARKNESQRWLKEVTEIKWLDNGIRICWKAMDASLHMYDFESKVKWKWGQGRRIR